MPNELNSPRTDVAKPWDPINELYLTGEASLPPEIDLSTATRRSLREQEVIYRAGMVALGVAQEFGAEIPNRHEIMQALKEHRSVMPQHKNRARVIVDSLRHRFRS